MKVNKSADIIDYGKLPPQAIDFEEIVLGALMVESESIMTAITILTADMFYKESHQRIYQSIIDLDREDLNVDIITVTEKLRKKEELDSIGGPFYVTQLTSKVVSAANIEYHSRIIQQKYLQRELIRISTEINSKSYDESNDLQDILDYSFIQLEKINESAVNNSPNSFYDNIDLSLKAYEERIVNRKSGLNVAINTGLGMLNGLLIGFMPGDLVILAARPSIGKTALSLHFAKAAAKYGNNVDIFSAEMTTQSLTDRMILGETDINPNDYRAGRETNWNELDTAATRIRSYDISINDEMDINVNYIRATIRKKFKKNELGLVIIDYLQLMEGRDKSSKNNEIGSITRDLKKIATKFKCPILLLSQLSRDVEKRGNTRHKLSDLRDSGNIEQDADVVMFISRNRIDSEGNDVDYSIEENRVVTIDISKNRNGSTGAVQCYCNEYVNRFYEKDERFDNNDNQMQPSRIEVERDEIPF